MMSKLSMFANLINQRNEIDRDISAILGRPAHSGHIAEYIAAAIFGIDLHASASTKAHDGFFRSGELAGRSVNIKYGTRRDGNLNLVYSTDPSDHPEFYLVPTGPAVAAQSSVGLTAPWVFHAVYLFESRSLVEYLTNLGRQPGVATSIRREVWNAAMIHPKPQNPQLELAAPERDLLALFSDSDPPTKSLS